jgi:hypothetical protein
MQRLHDMGEGGGMIDDKAARQGGAWGVCVHWILQEVTYSWRASGYYAATPMFNSGGSSRPG